VRLLRNMAVGLLVVGWVAVVGCVVEIWVGRGGI